MEAHDGLNEFPRSECCSPQSGTFPCPSDSRPRLAHQERARVDVEPLRIYSAICNAACAGARRASTEDALATRDGHPFGTIKARMGATHFLTKMLPPVAAEVLRHMLAHNLTRVTNIMGVQPLLAAMRTSDEPDRVFPAVL